MPTTLGDARPLASHVTRACEMLVANGERLLGCPGPFEAEIIDTRRRAHSVVNRIRLTSRDGSEGRFFLKTLNANPANLARKLRECATEYRLLAELTDVFARSEELGVVRPVACWVDDLAFLTEEFSGRNVELALRDCVRRIWSRQARREAIDLCRRAGAWLARFQDHTRVGAPAALDIDELIAYCALRVDKIQASPGNLLSPALGEAIMRHLEGLAARFTVEEREVVGRHNDFRPDNMLIGHGRLVVVDFTGFTHGPRLYDFMKFWMRLEYMAFGPFPFQRTIATLKAAFAQGYVRAVDQRAPMSRFLRIANLLDKMWGLADPSPRPFTRQLLEKRWHRHLLRELAETVESTR